MARPILTGSTIAVRVRSLVDMRIPLLDALRRLADACAARGRWEPRSTAAPWQIDTQTSSPVHPVAAL